MKRDKKGRMGDSSFKARILLAPTGAGFPLLSPDPRMAEMSNALSVLHQLAEAERLYRLEENKHRVVPYAYAGLRRSLIPPLLAPPPQPMDEALMEREFHDRSQTHCGPCAAQLGG